MNARSLLEHVAVLRAEEDAALAEWYSACEVFDRAVSWRGRRVGRAEVAVVRAMRPVLPHHYVRIEKLIDAGPAVMLARSRGWALGFVYHSRPEVNAAREHLASVRATEDGAVAAARAERAAATARLMDAWAYPDVATGLSMQRLGRLRAVR